MVILEPFWRIDTGNLLLGRLVSHRRKSLCTCRGERMCYPQALNDVVTPVKVIGKLSATTPRI